MRELLDYLVRNIRNNQAIWHDAASGKLDDGFAQMLESTAASNWHSITDRPASPSSKVVGADGRKLTRVLWSGAIWWIVRAVAVQEQKSIRAFHSGLILGGTTEQA